MENNSQPFNKRGGSGQSAEDVPNWDPFEKDRGSTTHQSTTGKSSPPSFQYGQASGSQHGSGYQQRTPQTYVSAAMGSTAQGFDAPPIDDQIADPSLDPFIQNMKAKYRRGERNREKTTIAERSLQNVRGIYREEAKREQKEIAGLESRGLYQTENGRYQHMINYRPFNPRDRRVLYPQRVMSSSPLDAYRQRWLAAKKERKQEWSGMEHRKVFQKSQFKVNEWNEATAQANIKQRRRLIRKGFTVNLHSEPHISPVVPGMKRGLSKIREKTEPPVTGHQYFPQQFRGFPSRRSEGQLTPIDTSDYSSTESSESDDSDSESSSSSADTTHKRTQETDEDTEWENI